MRPEKFTAKMQEAFNSSDRTASDQSLGDFSEHFLLALLRRPDGLVRPLLQNLERRLLRSKELESVVAARDRFRRSCGSQASERTHEERHSMPPGGDGNSGMNI
jgi:hypothetical protein